MAVKQMTEEQIIEIIRRELASAYHSGRKIEEKPLTQFLDGRNISFGGGTGTKLGTSTSQKIGFFNKAPVSQQADISALTYIGTPDNAVADVTASFNQTILNDNFADIASQINDVRTVLRNLGLMA